VELSSWSLRQRGYRHHIPGTAPSHTPSGAHTPTIIVIRESGLTITELELELEIGSPSLVSNLTVNTLRKSFSLSDA